ncbi:T9SS type A sorting domain-containing protein [Chryseobacterium gwangjuense]|uniref:T9SS type A sorting domain-containing protein n=1 Tax=Chryseobacterium gwangjuense TaxID=1069980 RepID=UPI001E3C5A80|nr:T9SS type A sorting domain-containing protein [Chryseobacterium gwangjuense]MCE3074181.1 T9SS type A sorting domain-containing protein [Chryseobacterium gwangjuense]
MNVKSTRFIYLSIFLAGSFSLQGQIKNQNNKVWKKSDIEASRDSAKCNKESLLNFHCNIRNHLKQPVKYSKNAAQTLIVVHNSVEEENIWNNKDIIAELSNHSYKRSKSSELITLKKKPSIISYVSPKQRSNKDSLNIQVQDKNLYEVFFAPQKLKKTELEKLHSYLSIKYGISLEKSKYFNSSGEVIWDPEKHKEFKKRPTGIGRDDANELYQKQSSNQEDRTVAIGRNKIFRTNFDNSSSLDNNTFAIWSDDDNPLDFEIKENLKQLKRNWEISFIGKGIPKTGYAVQISKKIINPEELRLNYWMLIKNEDGTYQKIAGKAKGDVVEYSGVSFSDEKDTAVFTFATNNTDIRQPDKSNQDKEETPKRTRGAGEGTSDLQYLLYPNPVKMNDYFTVKFPATKDLEITLYDGGGRKITSEKIAPDTTEYHNKLNVQGVYLIVLTQNKTLIKAFKLIVD